MKMLKAFVPVVVVLGVLAFAIWQVRSQAVAQAAAESAAVVTRSSAPAPQLSDRYSGNVGIAQ